MSRDNTVVTVVSKISDNPVCKEAALVVIYGLDLGKKFSLGQESLVIGRSSKAGIRIDQDAISRNHCTLATMGKNIVIKDLGSTNGTFVNDEQIDEYVLRDGDFVKVGRCIFKFLSGDNIENSYHEEIYRLTTVDGLTQIFNKRYFIETLESELARAQRYERDLSLIMFDIDHFKPINDTCGHIAGDEVLRSLAQTVSTKIRREDIFARYGGEEFAIILPEINLEGAMQIAEKVRAIIDETVFEYEDREVPVTVSVGVTSLPGAELTVNEFIREADENLYKAKDNGRNNVVGPTR